MSVNQIWKKKLIQIWSKIQKPQSNESSSMVQSAHEFYFQGRVVYCTPASEPIASLADSSFDEERCLELEDATSGFVCLFDNRLCEVHLLHESQSNERICHTILVPSPQPVEWLHHITAYLSHGNLWIALWGSVGVHVLCVSVPDCITSSHGQEPTYLTVSAISVHRSSAPRGKEAVLQVQWLHEERKTNNESKKDATSLWQWRKQADSRKKGALEECSGPCQGLLVLTCLPATEVLHYNLFKGSAKLSGLQVQLLRRVYLLDTESGLVHWALKEVAVDCAVSRAPCPVVCQEAPVYVLLANGDITMGRLSATSDSTFKMDCAVMLKYLVAPPDDFNNLEETCHSLAVLPGPPMDILFWLASVSVNSQDEKENSKDVSTPPKRSYQFVLYTAFVARIPNSVVLSSRSPGSPQSHDEVRLCIVDCRVVDSTFETVSGVAEEVAPPKGYLRRSPHDPLLMYIVTQTQRESRLYAWDISWSLKARGQLFHSSGDTLLDPRLVDQSVPDPVRLYRGGSSEILGWSPLQPLDVTDAMPIMDVDLGIFTASGEVRTCAASNSLYFPAAHVKLPQKTVSSPGSPSSGKAQEFQDYMEQTYLAPLHLQIKQFHSHTFVPPKTTNSTADVDLVELLSAANKHQERIVKLLDGVMVELARRKNIQVERVRTHRQEVKKCGDLMRERAEKARLLQARLEMVLAKEETLKMMVDDITARLKNLENIPASLSGVEKAYIDEIRKMHDRLTGAFQARLETLKTKVADIPDEKLSSSSKEVSQEANEEEEERLFDVLQVEGSRIQTLVDRLNSLDL